MKSPRQLGVSMMRQSALEHSKHWDFQQLVKQSKKTRDGQVAVRKSDMGGKKEN